MVVAFIWSKIGGKVDLDPPARDLDPDPVVALNRGKFGRRANEISRCVIKI